MPRCRLAGMSCALIIAGAVPAWADVIDGHWCFTDGERISIQGPAIVTPAGSQHPGRLFAPLLHLRGATDRSRRGTDRLHDADQRGHGAFAHRSRAVLFVGRADAGLAPLRPADELTPNPGHTIDARRFNLATPAADRAGRLGTGTRRTARAHRAGEGDGRRRPRRAPAPGRPPHRPRAHRPHAGRRQLPRDRRDRRQGHATTRTAGRSSPSCRPTACSAAARWMAARW